MTLNFGQPLLLHDVGKAIDIQAHDIYGANLLKGLLSPRIVWLVENHLNLLNSKKKLETCYKIPANFTS